MRTALKISVMVAAGLITLVIALVTATIIFQNKVAALFIDYLNKNLSTKIVVDNYRLSLLRRFPDASIEMKNVTVFSSGSFDKIQFSEYQCDTLLQANLVSLEFSLTNLLEKKYNIKSATVAGGKLFLLSDSTGNVNYTLILGTKKKDYDSTNNMTINLEKVTVRNMLAYYNNKSVHLNIKSNIDYAKLRSRLSGSDLDFICTTDITVNEFNLYSMIINSDIRVQTDINLNKSENEITFRTGSIKLDGFPFELTGFIKPEKNLLIKITGHNIEIAKLRKYLPQKYREKYSEYSLGGFLNAECVLSGPASRKTKPLTEIRFSVERGKIYYGKSNIKLENLSLQGTYFNERMADPSTAKIEIPNCIFNLGNATCKADFSANNFKNPRIKMNFSGDIIPGEVQKFIKIPGLLSSEGSFRLNLKLDGNPVIKKNYSLNDLLSLNMQADIQLKSLGINHRDDRLSFSDASGNIMLASNLWAEDLVFTYKGQRFKINGEFVNFPAWIAGKPVEIKINADIYADSFNPVLFRSANQNYSKPVSKAKKMPRGIEAKLTFRAGNFTYRNFVAENINGIMYYRPGIIEFRNLSVNALDGLISGNFITATQNKGTAYAFKGDFVFNGIDIKKGFYSFNNFGQNFIRAEHISGALSGKVKLLMQLDTLFRPEIKSVNAEGRYIIENGNLANFEPVMALSKFISISELENIKFSKLENDFFIKNNQFALPQMDIKSSAADFSVSGSHSFDNNYEYHIKAYLSELLSGKIKKNQNITEFGAIEEDGLGRTSLFLKITGTGNNIKVSYDLKAAVSKIKQSLNREKSNLKTIFNEEYGGYKRDTTVKNKPVPAPKFKIEWSETEQNELQKDTSVIQKENILNRLFKRKNNNQQE